MTVTTIDSTPTPRSASPPGHFRMQDLMRIEWTKLRTVRSTIWTLGMTVLVGLAASAIATAVTSAHWTTMSTAGKASFNPVDVSLTGVNIGCTLLIGILGILVVSSEYGTGTIRATLTAAPRRPMVFAAKVIVFGVVALVVSEIVAFASFLLGQALLTAPAKHAILASPGALRAVVGIGLFLGVVGLLALGIAGLIRHTAGGTSAYVGLILVAPLIVSAFPNPLHYQIQRFLPLEISSVMTSTAYPHAFGPWAGFLVLCSYTAAVLAIGTVLLVRRDA